MCVCDKIGNSHDWVVRLRENGERIIAMCNNCHQTKISTMHEKKGEIWSAWVETEILDISYDEYLVMRI